MNNAYDSRTLQSDARVAAYDEGLRKYMLGVYNYMASGLVLSGILAGLTLSSGAVNALITVSPNGYLQYTSLGMVASFSPLVMLLGVMFMGRNMSVSATQVFYWVFVGLMGVSLSTLGVIYTGESIARTLFVTAGTFGAMSLWGYTTKRDLTRLGSFLIMGVIGILIAGVVNMFMQSSMLHFLISGAGVLVFTLLTAYDTQQQKGVYYTMNGDTAGLEKSAVWGALSLYLNFINLFQFLLAFMGNRE